MAHMTHWLALCQDLLQDYATLVKESPLLHVNKKNNIIAQEIYRLCTGIKKCANQLTSRFELDCQV